MIAPDFVRTRGIIAGGVVAVVLLGAGLVLSRIDIALLALPLLLAVLAGAERRPAAGDAVTAAVTLDAAPTAGGELGFTVAIRAPASVAAVAVRLTLLGSERHELVVDAAAAEQLTGRVALLHSGPQQLVAVDYRLLGADAASVSRVLGPLVASRAVAPPRGAIARLALPRRLHGLTGMHPSARAGDGGEFRDVSAFVPGDRLRRIDWKATARRSRGAADLHVRRTDALSDATVVLIVDSRDDVGEQLAQWRRDDPTRKGVSVLDLAREAAAAIAEGYITAGDRVGLQDLAAPRRIVAHAGGGRQLWRLLRAIELIAPTDRALSRQRPPLVPAGALVYLFSALLDDQPIPTALRWRGDGHRVILVDVLPAARMDATTRYERTAHRILMMQRAERLRILQAGGVELLRWARDAGTSREARLAQLSRPPRAGRR